MKSVYLIACVARKKRTRHPARELYDSDWFKKARAYVESTGMPWFILSAKYGLLHPDQVIAPYNKTLNAMGVRQRRSWAERVKVQLGQQLPPADRVVVLAGQKYREFLLDDLQRLCTRVEVPLRGLRIGEQLRKLGSGTVEE